jgi:hypothetical protein
LNKDGTPIPPRLVRSWGLTGDELLWREDVTTVDFSRTAGKVFWPLTNLLISSSSAHRCLFYGLFICLHYSNIAHTFSGSQLIFAGINVANTSSSLHGSRSADEELRSVAKCGYWFMVWVLDNACMVLICLWSPPSSFNPWLWTYCRVNCMYYGSCALL